MQKEGIIYCSHIGTSVSYTSLQNMLQSAETLVQQQALKMKYDLTATPSIVPYPGYVMSMDNLDYYVRVRSMTSIHQNSMHHYVQVDHSILNKMIY